MRRMNGFMVAAALGLLLPVAAGAQSFNNGGFETGDFTGWTVSGTAAVVGTVGVPSIPPPVGNFQAGLQTNGGAEPFAPNDTYTSAGGLETFLGMGAGDLAALRAPGTTGDIEFGTAIAQSVTVAAGDQLRFRWNFVTLEFDDEDLFNDFSFVSIGGVGQRLAAADDSDFGPLTGPDVLLNASTFRTSGYQEFVFTFNSAGTFLVGVGVVNVGDDSVSSGLLVDDFRIIAIPEPATMTLIGLAVAGGGYCGWQQRKRKLVVARAAKQFARG